MRETKIKIKPFSFVSLEDIRIEQKVNEHAKAVVYGLLDSERIKERRNGINWFNTTYGGE